MKEAYVPRERVRPTYRLKKSWPTLSYTQAHLKMHSHTHSHMLACVSMGSHWSLWIHLNLKVDPLYISQLNELLSCLTCLCEFELGFSLRTERVLTISDPCWQLSLSFPPHYPRDHTFWIVIGFKKLNIMGIFLCQNMKELFYLCIKCCIALH